MGSSSISADGTFEEIDSFNSGGFSTYFSRPAYQDIAVPQYVAALEEGTYEGLYDPSGRGSELVIISLAVTRVGLTTRLSH